MDLTNASSRARRSGLGSTGIARTYLAVVALTLFCQAACVRAAGGPWSAKLDVVPRARQTKRARKEDERTMKFPGDSVAVVVCCRPRVYRTLPERSPMSFDSRR